MLQCEFCNKTYSEKKSLLFHQRKHTTAANYECVTCKEVFESYAMAAKHWLTKCTDEANLFYLPKMTYCECCDRTFKSHDILYTHKIKKKHYTPKPFAMPIEISKTVYFSNETSSNVGENKDSIVKLIEHVLLEMKIPESQIKDKIEIHDDERNLSQNEDSQNDVCMDTDDQNITIEIKSEILSETSSRADNTSQELTVDLEKKKRGRKRKWPKQTTKAKRLAATVEPGYKYQCERCIKVWESVIDLETHREKEHPANFKCEECDQVYEVLIS